MSMHKSVVFYIELFFSILLGTGLYYFCKEFTNITFNLRFIHLSVIVVILISYTFTMFRNSNGSLYQKLDKMIRILSILSVYNYLLSFHIYNQFFEGYDALIGLIIVTILIIIRITITIIIMSQKPAKVTSTGFSSFLYGYLLYLLHSTLFLLLEGTIIKTYIIISVIILIILMMPKYLESFKLKLKYLILLVSIITVVLINQFTSLNDLPNFVLYGSNEKEYETSYISLDYAKKIIFYDDLMYVKTLDSIEIYDSNNNLLKEYFFEPGQMNLERDTFMIYESNIGVIAKVNTPEKEYIGDTPYNRKDYLMDQDDVKTLYLVTVDEMEELMVIYNEQWNYRSYMDYYAYYNDQLYYSESITRPVMRYEEDGTLIYGEDMDNTYVREETLFADGTACYAKPDYYNDGEFYYGCITTYYSRFSSSIYTDKDRPIYHDGYLLYDNKITYLYTNHSRYIDDLDILLNNVRATNFITTEPYYNALVFKTYEDGFLVVGEVITDQSLPRLLIYTADYDGNIIDYTYIDADYAYIDSNFIYTVRDTANSMGDVNEGISSYEINKFNANDFFNVEKRPINSTSNQVNPDIVIKKSETIISFILILTSLSLIDPSLTPKLEIRKKQNH